MIVHDRRSNPVTRFLPEFRFSHVPPLSAISIERYAATASVKPHLFTTNLLPLLLCYKETVNVFNKIRTLFSGFFSANPLLSILSSLFQLNRGVGYNHSSKIRCVDRG
jgi:hypothetical protein